MSWSECKLKRVQIICFPQDPLNYLKREVWGQDANHVRSSNNFLRRRQTMYELDVDFQEFTLAL